MRSSTLLPFATCTFVAIGALHAQTTRWELKAPSNSPSPRDAYSMAHDSSRGRTVMFNGAAETWEWTGFTWVRNFPSFSPKQRTGHAMAYDAVRRRVVLFGGQGSSAAWFNDTWLWDGFSWTRATPASSPSVRQGHAMAFDSLRGRIVLFGGGDGLTLWNDTWEWDGTEWIRVLTPVSPPWREGHAMAFDSARNRAVLFGGNPAAPLADTWEWDGTNWTNRTPAGGPSGRALHQMAFDASRNRTALFGGTTAALQGLSDTWEWDGNAWFQPTATGGIAGLYNHAMAYDTFRRRVVLFGGRGDPASAPRNETWEYSDSVPATYATFGTGCGRNPVLAPEPGSLPWGGTTFRLRLTGLPPTSSATFIILGYSKTSWFGQFPLPFPLDGIGMTGCTLYVRGDLVFTVTNQGGVASLPIAIPNDPTAPGTIFYNQGFAFDQGANPLGIIVSNAGEGFIGKQ
jgi:hypothetical protein